MVKGETHRLSLTAGGRPSLSKTFDKAFRQLVRNNKSGILRACMLLIIPMGVTRGVGIEVNVASGVHGLQADAKIVVSTLKS